MIAASRQGEKGSWQANLICYDPTSRRRRAPLFSTALGQEQSVGLLSQDILLGFSFFSLSKSGVVCDHVAMTDSVHAATARPYRVLLVYPRFASDSFWVYTAACEIVGARHPTAPLGLITVAALLPSKWDLRLVDRNIEDLSDADLQWADLVMTGGMLMQQVDALTIIERAHRFGKPVAVGGPDVTSHPHRYELAEFLVLGEAEGIIDGFVAAWEAGARKGTFEAPKFQVDLTKTTIPRFDLLKLDRYLYVGVQFSRGCPFTCEFCDIIELYGRVPRTKTIGQMLAELDAIYESGYRGHVDFVDDNLIGNKKAVKAFLPQLKSWLEQHHYPFEFSTEASLNLADDFELLALMRDANFFGIFIGIESPDAETLRQTKKKQNTRRSIPDSIHRIYSYGMFVTAGFIVGFDSENGSVAEPMIGLIEETSIPVAMIGLLYALSTTQLGRRLKTEGRLHENHDRQWQSKGDHCTAGLNFDTLRPRLEILADYRKILERIYDANAFAGRLRRLCDLLDRSKCRRRPPMGDIKLKAGATATLNRIVRAVPEALDVFRETFAYCVSTNPRAARLILQLMALYLHLGPFSRKVIDAIDCEIARSDCDRLSGPYYPRDARVQSGAASQ